MNATNNKTQVQLGPDGWDNLFLYGCYILQGFFIGLGNIIIICAIVRYRALRTSKVHVLLMALAVADSFHLFALVWGGVYRTIKVIDGTHSAMMRAWDCMWTVHSFIWSFAHSQSALMLAVVSLDRLFSVLKPLEYIGWPVSYAWCMIGTTYIYTWAVGFLGISLTYHTRTGPPDQVSAACIPPQAFNYSNKAYASYFAFAPVVFAMASILLYITIGFVYKHRQAEVDDITNERGRNTQIEHERRITRSLGIACLCTFVFYVVPWLAGNVTTWIGYSSINFVFWVMANINPACNLLIYPLKMPEIRRAIHGLFTCKELPDHLDVWRNVVTNRTTDGNAHLHHQPVAHHQKKQHQEELQVIDLV